jgi:hypothetical protein
MKTKIHSTIFLLLILLYANMLQAQSGTHAAGIEATSGSGQVSASVGQVFTATNSSPSAYLAEGVHQPYEISVITSVQPLSEAAAHIDVYPNPFTDAVNIRLENRTAGDWMYILYTMNGKQVMQGRIDSDVTFVPAAFLAKGTYMLRIMKGNTQAKSFKIIKN